MNDVSQRYNAPGRADQSSGRLETVLSVMVVFFWSTGFVVPRAFGPHVEMMTFVAARNLGALAALACIAGISRSPWPHKASEWLGLAWAGALFQGFYLMALYWAILHGLPVAIAALIGALQPALTALFAALMLRERLSRLQIAGMLLGLVGVGITMSPRFGTAGFATWIGLAMLGLAGVAGGAYGSIFQKRFEHVGDDWSRTALLFAGASIPPLIGALVFDRQGVTLDPALVAVYLWATLALGVGGTTAMLYLIRQGQAARAASLLYFVPPLSAVMAYAGFGERITAAQVVGFAVAAVGVACVRVRA